MQNFVYLLFQNTKLKIKNFDSFIKRNQHSHNSTNVGPKREIG